MTRTECGHFHPIKNKIPINQYIISWHAGCEVREESGHTHGSDPIATGRCLERLIMLTQDQIAVINATVPAVEAHAREITEHFYPLMFERYPEVKAYFNQAHQAKGTQRQALANAIIAYAANIERLEALGDAVNLIAHKHCSLDIRPEQYPIVGECLLDAIVAVLGEAATPEVLDAWGAAYQQLADILIGAEEAIYDANSQREGGWRGERAFLIADKVVESDVITSLYLEPADGAQAPIDFTPGQYVGLVLNIDGQTVRRNYSLSDSPGKSRLRISVKREDGGQVSGFLHDRLGVGDTLNLTAPCGDFVLNDSDRPLFLVTGGVGITPAMSMLNAAVDTGRPIVFVHAARNARSHAFRDHVDNLAREYDNLTVRYVYDAPDTDDTPHATGLVEREMLASLMPADRDVDFYFLGPQPFMRLINGFVADLGIPAEQIRYEFFGPLQDLEEPEEERSVA